jgi:hypothetical protein
MMKKGEKFIIIFFQKSFKKSSSRKILAEIMEPVFNFKMTPE